MPPITSLVFEVMSGSKNVGYFRIQKLGSCCFEWVLGVPVNSSLSNVTCEKINNLWVLAGNKPLIHSQIQAEGDKNKFECIVQESKFWFDTETNSQPDTPDEIILIFEQLIAFFRLNNL